ncbi:glutathione S-transferase [Sphingomonas sp.]|uniref:glutathione S-transferase n=1 Tax=Sphingomonas sp. TaxID=28214 RepID=UPI001B0B7498|nr:glutathione S-transferase [Sphingomonas sp.]MBO9713364.1 glutathione S-transferase [Sphingomonas sp.]
MAYELWYWTGIQGRGEFVRLPMEAAGIAYVEPPREATSDGDDALIADMAARGQDAPFAPPYLVANGAVIAQVALILDYLGARHDIAPSDPAERRRLHQVQLTISDLIAEVHQVHHPVGMDLYYTDQKPEAARFAREFREQRMPKFLGWLEAAVLGDWVAGDRWSYADTSIFQLVEGLRYMFPRRMATLEPDHPKLAAIRDRVVQLPGIRAYLDSGRRLAFNTNGIFRHYPELDAE